MSNFILLAGNIAPFLVLAAAASEPGLQIRGQVVLPDGTPAAKATLASGRTSSPFANCETDAEGRFTLSGLFYEDAQIIARSSDETMQREFTISNLEARLLTAKPVRIELRPAITVTLHVARDGESVPNARVASEPPAAKPIVTDAAGLAQWLVPDNQISLAVFAWHPDFGIAGKRGIRVESGKPATTIELALNETRPRRVRVVDHRQQPVAGLKVWPSFRPKGTDWFRSRGFSDLHGMTRADGEVTFAWAPKNLEYFDGEWPDKDWLLEQVENPTEDRDVPTVQVRKKRAFRGKLIVPEGCNPVNLMIAGHSFGPRQRFDFAATRAAPDGSFSLSLAPEHCYALSVCDPQWASEPIVAVFAREGTEELMAPLEIKVHRATPLEIRATAGPQHMPLRDTFVLVSRNVESEWEDADGQSRRGLHGISHWVKTDEDGYVRSGIGRGSYAFSIFHEKWQSEKKLVVDSDKPLAITFHKPYEGRREIKGQLIGIPERSQNFAGVKIAALESSPANSNAADIVPEPDGRFVFTTDFPTVALYALDATSSLCGSAVVSEAESATKIKLEPTAMYRGTLIDDNGVPLANVPLVLRVKAAPTTFVRQTTTDGDGRFRFGLVFVNVELQLLAEKAGQSHLVARQFFEPGERRTDVEVKWSAGGRAESPKALQERLQAACRDVGLADMRVLLVVAPERDDAQKFVQSRILDFEANPPVWHFLPVAVTSEALGAAAADSSYFAKMGWPLPAADRICLVALSARSQTLGNAEIDFADAKASAEVTSFLERHKPELADAQQSWENALALAKNSERRVLVQFGGARCGPCFRFSRWIDDYREQIDSDYVVLKLHSDRHPGADKIEERLRGKSGSIPWTAIVDAEGNVLATSDGPLGNFGFPGDFESVRHFRRMLEATAKRLTHDEIAALMGTLDQ